MSEYTDYIERKLSTVPSTGIAEHVDLPASLFPHQRVLTAWAIDEITDELVAQYPELVRPRAADGGFRSKAKVEPQVDLA